MSSSGTQWTRRPSGKPIQLVEGMESNRTFIVLAAAMALATVTVDAAELAVPESTFGKLDHVFLIMMENETNTDVLSNPIALFINAYANVANQATNYFA